MIASLDQRLEAETFGEKAARLAVARREGLPVPAGFVIDPDLAARVAQSELVDAERDDLARRLAALNGPVVVRSSAVGEDAPGTSFAGQHLSILNVEGLIPVLEAITRVWQSGTSEPALAYRRHMGVMARPRVAVLVQALIPADVAGVLFTADPVSGSAERWVIEASWGLGESVVSGAINPDLFVISPAGAVLERRVSDKAIAVVADAGGGTVSRSVDSGTRRAASLHEADLRRLAHIGRECERIFGPRQDIEWGLLGDDVHLLQVRPITTLPR